MLELWEQTVFCVLAQRRKETLQQCLLLFLPTGGLGMSGEDANPLNRRLPAEVVTRQKRLLPELESILERRLLSVSCRDSLMVFRWIVDPNFQLHMAFCVACWPFLRGSEKNSREQWWGWTTGPLDMAWAGPASLFWAGLMVDVVSRGVARSRWIWRQLYPWSQRLVSNGCPRRGADCDVQTIQKCTHPKVAPNSWRFQGYGPAHLAEALRMVEDKRASSTELYDIAPETILLPRKLLWYHWQLGSAKWYSNVQPQMTYSRCCRNQGWWASHCLKLTAICNAFWSSCVCSSCSCKPPQLLAALNPTQVSNRKFCATMHTRNSQRLRGTKQAYWQDWLWKLLEH